MNRGAAARHPAGIRVPKKPPTEAVNIAHATSVHAYYYGDGTMTISNLLHFIRGTALKDNP